MAILGSTSPSAHSLAPRTDALALAVMRVSDGTEGSWSGEATAENPQGRTLSPRSADGRRRRVTKEEDQQLKQGLRRFLHIEQLPLPEGGLERLAGPSLPNSRNPGGSEYISSSLVADTDGLGKDEISFEGRYGAKEDRGAATEVPVMQPERFLAPQRDRESLKRTSTRRGNRETSDGANRHLLTSQPSRRCLDSTLSRTAGDCSRHVRTRDRVTDRLVQRAKEDEQSAGRALQGQDEKTGGRQEQEENTDAGTTWLPRNTTAHLLGAMIGAWSISSYFVIVGGSSLSISKWIDKASYSS